MIPTPKAPLEILEAPASTLDHGLRAGRSGSMPISCSCSTPCSRPCTPRPGSASPPPRSACSSARSCSTSASRASGRRGSLINPELVWRSESETVAEEGCLSLPKQFGEVARADQVRVRHLDRAGETREIDAEGLLARCLQHEIDHLNGILFVDHLSALKRTMILRRLAKAKRTRQSA